MKLFFFPLKMSSCLTHCAEFCLEIRKTKRNPLLKLIPKDKTGYDAEIGPD